MLLIENDCLVKGAFGQKHHVRKVPFVQIIDGQMGALIDSLFSQSTI